MSKSSHLSCCTQLRGRREPISNNVFSLINNPASLLANKTKVHCGLLNWMWMCGLKLANAVRVTGWGRACWETEFASSSRPPLYISLYSLSVSCHLTTLCLLGTHFIYLQVDQNFQQIYRTACSSCGRQSTAWHGRPWRTPSCPHTWPRPPPPSWSPPPACAGHLACTWMVPHCRPDNISVELKAFLL